MRHYTSIHPTSQSSSQLCDFYVSAYIPDYLNNLSPDSKEYEDTQGKPAEDLLCHCLRFAESP